MKKDFQQLLSLLPWAKPYKLWIVGLLFCAFGFFSLAQANPLFISWVIDWAIPSGKMGALLLIVGIFFGVIFLRQLFSVFMIYAYTLLGSRISADIQHDLLSRLLRVDIRYFHDRQQGDILARITEDVYAIREFLSVTIVDILSNIFALVFSIIVMGWFNLKLAMAILVFLPLIPMPFKLMHPKLRKVFFEQRNANGANVAFLQEMLSAILPIKIAGAISEVLNKQHNVIQVLISTTVRQRTFQMMAAYASEFFGNLLSPLLVFTFGGYLVFRNELTIGQLVASEMYAVGLVGPVVALSKTGALLQGVLASLDRIKDITNAPQQDYSTRVLISRPLGNIKVQDLCFSYNSNGQRLSGISLSADRGELVAIVGPSGSGKSTLACLLSGIFVPDSGRVLIDGHDVHLLENRAEIVTLVPQEPFLFHGTVASNLRFGCNNPDWTSMEGALIAAGVHEFVKSLPQGYDTIIGERGITMSGGERQRLVLANAFLRKPHVLILDEVTSALDAVSEQVVWNSLKRLRGEATIFVITHRISSAIKADRVYVMQNGQIIESGAPGTLLAAQGLFYELYKNQTEDV